MGIAWVTQAFSIFTVLGYDAAAICRHGFVFHHFKKPEEVIYYSLTIFGI
jgi:hypothetical protein